LRCRDNSQVAIRFRKERRTVGHISRPAVLSHIRASAFGPRDLRKQRPIQGELPVPLLEARRERSGDRPAADRRMT